MSGLTAVPQTGIDCRRLEIKIGPAVRVIKRAASAGGVLLIPDGGSLAGCTKGAGRFAVGHRALFERIHIRTQLLPVHYIRAV